MGHGSCGSAEWWITWVTGHKMWPTVSSKAVKIRNYRTHYTIQCVSESHSWWLMSTIIGCQCYQFNDRVYGDTAINELSRIGLPRVLEYSSTPRVVNYSSNFVLLEYSLISISGCKFPFPVDFFASSRLSWLRLMSSSTGGGGRWRWFRIPGHSRGLYGRRGLPG